MARPRRLPPESAPSSLGVVGFGIVITTVLSLPVESKVRDTSLGEADSRNAKIPPKQRPRSNQSRLQGKVAVPSDFRQQQKNTGWP